MIDASPADRQVAKEIMIAYIAAMGNTANVMFRKDATYANSHKNFSETWESILKTVSDRN